MKPITATRQRVKGYKRGHRHKASVVALVDPATGECRAFNVKVADTSNVRNIWPSMCCGIQRS
jgi:hypothetical protein